MARGDCSYKRTTLVVCSVNVVVALYVFHSLYSSVYMYSFTDTHAILQYSENQISKMEESNQIRKSAEPTELIQLVSRLKERLLIEERVEDLPQHLKQKLIYEIVDRLRSLDAAANGTEQREFAYQVLGVGLWLGCRRGAQIEGALSYNVKFCCAIERDHSLEVGTCTLGTYFDDFTTAYDRKALFFDLLDAVESWRKQKLKEAKKLIRGKKLNTTILAEEASAVSRALGSYWSELSEEIGLWIPVEILNNEHDDKSDSDEEFDEETLPGKTLPPECHAELHTDYDGAAVRWGLTHHKDSAYECCMSCLDQARRAKPGEMKCNVWVYCPSETGCYSPDIYEHKNGECWLKYSETPKLNFKNKYPESYRDEHVNAPVVVPWASGVVSM